MYDLNKICFMCLNDDNSLKAVFHTDTQIDTAAQIKYILPEITIFNPDLEIYVHICSLCCTSLNSSYTFKKMCLENYSRLLQNTKLLQRTSDTQKQIFSELQKPMIKQERKENDEQRDQTTAVEDNIDAKEALITLGPGNSANPEYCQQIEFVKCEKVSDSEQDGSCDSNNSFDKDETDNQNFAISICSKTSDKPYLPKHTEIFKSEIKLKCLVCEKQFSKRRNLKLHLKIHQNIKDFECSVCGKQFVLKSNLKRHIKIHSGIKDFECTKCNKKFTQKINLQIHMKYHEGIKDFKCSICNKNFTEKNNLKRHMKIHACIKDYKCTICNKKFTAKNNLTRHTKIHRRVTQREEIQTT